MKAIFKSLPYLLTEETGDKLILEPVYFNGPKIIAGYGFVDLIVDPTDDQISAAREHAKKFDITHPVYLRLWHGRKTRDEELDDWGAEGPTFGPFDGVHVTYGNDIKLIVKGESHGNLTVVEDMVYYGGMYYGDWSIMGRVGLHNTTTAFDQSKADI